MATRTNSIPIAIACMILTSLLILAGCSSSGSNQAAKSETKPAAEQQVQAFDLSATIEETVLVNEESFEVKANSLDFKNDRAIVNLSITNKSSDAITVMAGTLGYSCNYINDFMVNQGHFNVEPMPGETVDADAYFALEELPLYGIHEIREIGIGIYARSSDGKTLFQSPVGIHTSLYATDAEDNQNFIDAISNPALQSRFDFTLLEASNNTCFEQNQVSVPSQALIKMDGDTALLIEESNDYRSTIRLLVSEISINGQLAYEGLWDSQAIAPGKNAMQDLVFAKMIESDKLDQFDLENISNVEFTLECVDDSNNTIVPATPVRIEF